MSPLGVDGFEVGRAEQLDGRVAGAAAAGDGVLEVAGGGQDAGVDDEGVAVRLQGKDSDDGGQ